MVKLVRMTNALNTHASIPALTVGVRVYMARTHAGMEIGELAEVAGISRNTIGNYEKGKTTPRPAALISIAFATGVDLNWLENGETPTGGNPGGG